MVRDCSSRQNNVRETEKFSVRVVRKPPEPTVRLPAATRACTQSLFYCNTATAAPSAPPENITAAPTASPEGSLW